MTRYKLVQNGHADEGGYYVEDPNGEYLFSRDMGGSGFYYKEGKDPYMQGKEEPSLFGFTVEDDLAKRQEKEKLKRMREAEKKKKLKAYQPTMHELWVTGYETHTGKHKQGIYQSKLSDSDKRKLDMVREAIELGDIGVGVDDMKKFTKAHALRLYVVLMKQRKIATIKKMIATKPENYILVNNILAFGSMLENLGTEPIIALDTETTGVDVYRDRVVGMSLTLPKVDKHYYIPFGHVTDLPQLKEELVIDSIKPYLEDNSLKKVLHNAKFDIHMLYNAHGIDLGGFAFDTMIGMILLNENEPSFALKNLATKYGRYFGFEDKSATFEELFGDDMKKNGDGFASIPLDIGHIYACKDTHLTWAFYQFIQEQFDRIPELREYYETIEKDITLVSVEMERNGFEIDFEYAEEYKKDLAADIAKLEEQLRYHFGEINVNSPAQLATKLYDEIGLADPSKKRSVDAKTLEKLAKQHEGCKVLLEYRDLNKLLSTYIEPLPQKAVEGRLHGEFNQGGTVTGRYSSRNPNLQNLPKKARKIIKAGKGKVIIGIDFSQIEPRVLAHMSKDAKFMLPYLTGRDLYSEIASNVFNKPLEECGDGSIYRKYAKVILLGVMYGMSPNALAEMLKISLVEATSFIDDFFNTYEDVTKFVQAMNDQADENGHVKTMFNRKRRFTGHRQVAHAYKAMCKQIQERYGFVPTDIWGSELPRNVKMKFWEVAKPYGRVKRMSVNAVIQGTAAEIMKKAMIKLWRHCLKMGYKMLATVHDEILIEVADTITIEEVEALEILMMEAVTLDLPIKVDTEMSLRWGEGVSKKEWFDMKGAA
ncbi:DNA polymerase [Bacillus cereus]|uniref:DNA polymerase n=1 Tax=Bacillus cereus TaxID=1396 RepID=UPI003558368E